MLKVLVADRLGLKIIILSMVFPVLLLPSHSWCESPDGSAVSAVSTPDSSNADDTSLNDLNKTEVVYSSSKSEQKTTEAPGTTTILTSSEIKAGGYRTLDDLFNAVRGFWVTSDRNYTYLGLRGMGSLGGYNSRVLLMIDGHRINDDVYGEFYSGEDATIDMDMVDHVEIIRGPAAASYGSNAVFGVINVITKKGKDINGVVLTAQEASLGTLGNEIQYGGITDSGFQWTLEGSDYYSAGNGNLYFPEYNDPANPLSANNGVAHDCDSENAQHGFASLQLDDWSLEGAVMHRFKVIPTGSYGSDFNNPNNYTDDLNSFAELAYHHGDVESGQWLARLYADAANYTGNYIYSGIPNVDIGNGAWGGAELRFTFAPFEKNKLSLGTEFTDNFEQYQKNYDVGSAPALDDSRQSTQWSLYAEDEVKFTSNLILNLGGRYDYFSVTGSQWIPRGSIIWQPVQPTVLKLIAGEGFRAPTPFELYYQDGGLSEESNPSLKNEVFETYEFDWEQNISQNHRTIFSLFHYSGSNLILGVPAADNPLLTIYENVGHVEVNGAEFEYQYSDDSGIQGRLSWSYQYDEDENAEYVLPDSPQNLGKASLQVPIDPRLLTVTAECQFTAASYGFNDVWAPDYTLLNLKLYSPHFIWDNVEATLSAYNLLNTTYYQPTAGTLLENTLQQDGLLVWGKLSLKL